MFHILHNVLWLLKGPCVTMSNSFLSYITCSLIVIPEQRDSATSLKKKKTWVFPTPPNSGSQRTLREQDGDAISPPLFSCVTT